MRWLVLLAAVSATAFAQEAESNMACVERLEMPVYPPLAAAARISGSVTATGVLASDGSVRTTFSPGAHRLLPPAVQKALGGSSFRKDCIGKSVTLVFNFAFGKELDPDRLPQRVSFGYPNQFWISVPPRVITDAP